MVDARSQWWLKLLIFNFRGQHQLQPASDGYDFFELILLFRPLFLLTLHRSSVFLLRFPGYDQSLALVSRGVIVTGLARCVVCWCPGFSSSFFDAFKEASSYLPA